MTIERQIADASADFQALIIDGWDTPAAIEEAATSNGLKPSVLEARLARASSIEEFAQDILRHADQERTRQLIYGLVERFVADGISWMEQAPATRTRMIAYLEGEIGRPLTGIELACAGTSYRKVRELIAERFHEKMMRDVRLTPEEIERENNAQNR